MGATQKPDAHTRSSGQLAPSPTCGVQRMLVEGQYKPAAQSPVEPVQPASAPPGLAQVPAVMPAPKHRANGAQSEFWKHRPPVPLQGWHIVPPSERKSHHNPPWQGPAPLVKQR